MPSACQVHGSGRGGLPSGSPRCRGTVLWLQQHSSTAGDIGGTAETQIWGTPQKVHVFEDRSAGPEVSTEESRKLLILHVSQPPREELQRAMLPSSTSKRPYSCLQQRKTMLCIKRKIFISKPSFLHTLVFATRVLRGKLSRKGGKELNT